MALFLASCDELAPQIKPKDRAALAALKGPDTGHIEGVLNAQASQAAAMGDFKRAAQTYKQLVDKYPDKTEYKLGLAESLRRAGDNVSSLTITDEILAKDSKNAAALENKGLALMGTGEFAEAGTAFGEVMKTDPNRWRTLNGIGILFAMKGKYDGAVAYFQAALNVSTDNPSVLNNAALTYAIDRQFYRAYDAFGRAKRHLEPGSAEMKRIDLNLALVYAVDGKLDEAEQTATPHLSKEALYNNMGYYSTLAKNTELAKTYLNMALTQSPTYYERAWKNLGALTGENTTMPPLENPPAANSPSAGGAQQAPMPNEMPVSAIPESKPAVPVAAVPASEGTEEPQKAETPKPEEKAAADTKKADEKKAASADAKDKAKKAEKTKKAEKAKKEEKAKKKEEKAKAKKKEEKPKAKKKAEPKKKKEEGSEPDKDGTDNSQKSEQPGINPDVILLHPPKEAATPAPQPNSEWDAVDKPQSEADKKELPPLPTESAPSGSGQQTR